MTEFSNEVYDHAAQMEEERQLEERLSRIADTIGLDPRAHPKAWLIEVKLPVSGWQSYGARLTREEAEGVAAECFDEMESGTVLVRPLFDAPVRSSAVSRMMDTVENDRERGRAAKLVNELAALKAAVRNYWRTPSTYNSQKMRFLAGDWQVPDPDAVEPPARHQPWVRPGRGRFVKCAACGYKWNPPSRITCRQCDADGIARDAALAAGG